MVTCMFIGSSQFDFDLYEKIQTAVEKVISKDDEIEFLFYRKAMKFHCLCFLAVLKAKHQFSNKKITITLIATDINEERLTETKLLGPPIWAFDKIAPILNTKDIKQTANLWNKIERKMVRESNYVIACCYPELRDIQYNLYTYALSQQHNLVFNLIDEKTTEFIQETIKTLPQDERFILEQINAGCTFASMAKNTGISASTIKFKDGRGRKRLRYSVINQLKKEQIDHGEMVSKVCSIISLNESANEPNETTIRFQEIINFLAKSINVTAFMLRPNDIISIKKRFPNRENLELTIVTHFHEDIGAIQKRYVPPFAKILNMVTEVKPVWARDLFCIKAMIAQSEYVICSLGEKSAMSDYITRHLKTQKGIAVLDLEKSPYISKQLMID